MKLTWKKTSGAKRARLPTNLLLPFHRPESDGDEAKGPDQSPQTHDCQQEAAVPPTNPPAGAAAPPYSQLAQSFRDQGDQLAQAGKYREALGKWEAALTLVPVLPVLHEQKAQVLLELGDAWNALKAASRATELDPNWCEAWVTLGRAQLNFGEPDASIKSFDRALVLNADSKDAQADRETAMQLVKKRKQLLASGLTNEAETRYKVGDTADI